MGQNRARICAYRVVQTLFTKMPAVWIAPIGEIDYSTKLVNDIELVKNNHIQEKVFVEVLGKLFNLVSRLDKQQKNAQIPVECSRD